MEKVFHDIIQPHQLNLDTDSRTFNRLGYLKIFVFLVAVICTALLISRGFNIWLVGLTVLLIVVFVSLWLYHYKVENRINYAKGIIAICNAHIDRITGGWASFKDIGAEFIDARHAYSSDLDIVGSKSLFQYLNTTNTWYGRQAFANDLLHPNYDIPEIQTRQKAIAELSNDIPFTNDVQYYLSEIGVRESDVQLVEELSNNQQFTRYKIVKIILTYLPVATFMLFICGLVFSQNIFYIAGATLFVLQSIIGRIWQAMPPKKYLGLMGTMPYKLGRFSYVINMLCQKDFDSEKLNQIKNRLYEAGTALKALERIENKLQVRFNGIIYIVLKVTLLWDYHCAFLLEEWKRKYAPHAETWFKSIGEMESLISFSHLPNVCTNTCTPEPLPNALSLTAQGLGHPLLSNDSRINNDISLDNRIFIISGSNMSGKTTFMRAMGVNILLARTGSFVCASALSCGIFEIMTSMRIADNLNEGVSTFYAELTRIKRIIDVAHKTPNLIFLIDEIFRGTNSIDRLAGAEAVLSTLDAVGSIGLITTHDLELCKLATTRPRIKNHSFSEYYQGNKICFDYKIKAGQSQTTNARFIMEMVGLKV